MRRLNDGPALAHPLSRAIAGIGAFLLLALAAAGSSRAQNNNPAVKRAAGQLLDEGIRRFEDNNFEGALEDFERAYALFPSPKIFVNIGRAFGALGRKAEAADSYERYLAETAADASLAADKRALAQAELASLRKELGQLHITISPPSATALLDRKPIIGLAPWGLYVLPGTHSLSASAPGYRTSIEQVVIAAGEQRSVALSLETSRAPATGPAAPPPFPATPQKPIPQLLSSTAHPIAPGQPASAGQNHGIAAVIVSGAGLALLGTGVYFALDAGSKADQIRSRCTGGCPAVEFNQLDGQGHDANLRAEIMLAVGAAALIGGGILYYWGHRQAQVPQTTLSVAVGTGGGIATCLTRF